MTLLEKTSPRQGGEQGYLRIATEEAFATTEMIEIYKELLDDPDCDPGVKSLLGFYFTHQSDRAVLVRERLLDLGENRLAEMKKRGIDKQILGLTSPGTQMLSKDKAVALARNSNDELSEACAKYPDQFFGMATCAPQDPVTAAKEIERAVGKLGMKGVIINSHTRGEYLDDPKFSPILEAIEALNVPLYLHPQTPPRDMIAPMLEAGLDGAIFGFGVETGFHALRLMTSGTLDRFPKLKIIIGHMGEALPYWMYRLDFMHAAGVKSKRYEAMPPTELTPSEYLQQRFYVTNSGVAWEPAIKFAQEVLGEDRVMYAMDYPYQCPQEEVETLDRMNISLDTKKKFFQTNAEKVFGL